MAEDATLTPAEAADGAGVGTSTILRLERGDGATLENLLRASRARSGSST